MLNIMMNCLQSIYFSNINLDINNVKELLILNVILYIVFI